MKNILIILPIFLLVNYSFSQSYNMTNGGNISTCSGTFYDNGGPGSNYPNNASQVYTICSNSAGFKLEMLFTLFDVETFWGDELCIYDGNSTSSPLIGCFEGTSLQGQTIYATGSCLTFDFYSDFSGTEPGWAATIRCKAPCQTINAQVNSVTPTPTGANNDIKMCLGDQVTLDGTATFPQNNTYYTQSLATSTFKWFVGGGLVKNGQNVSQTYNNTSVNAITLVVEDANGCTDTIEAGIAIVGLPPSFSSTTFTNNDTICLDDSVTISVSSIPTPVSIPPLGIAGTTFLPDGNGQSYNSPLAVNIFDPAATYQKGFLDNIFMNMEHSYLGDLQMEIICPNGQTAILKSYAAGGNDTHLGEPVDQGTSTTAGIGYTYKFSTKNTTHGTMGNEAGNYQYNYTDVLGNTYTNQDYLPAGSYLSEQDYNTQLIGCPLNGTWQLRITDNILSDDGYIFQWGLNFNRLVLPDTSGNNILPQVVTKNWNPDPTIISTPNDSTIRVLPNAPGTFSYTFNITDDFGCSHDTTLNVFVKNRATSNAGIDFTSCNLTYPLSPVPTAGATASSWDYYSNSGTGTNTFSNPNIANTTVTVDEYSVFDFIFTETVNGCETYPDTVKVNFVQLVNTIDITVDDDTICVPQSVTFTNNSDMSTFDAVLWEFGDGNTATDLNTTTHNYIAGCYDLKVTLSNSQGCLVDSVLPNFICAFNMPVAGFNFTPFQPVVPETDVDFTNTSTSNLYNNWFFDNLGTSTLSDPNFVFPNTEAGNYRVKLVVENIAGCKDSITKNVIIKNTLSYFIPNSFTPNGDGANDIFKVVFSNNEITDYSLRIFNRWGTTLFYTEDINFEWDGKHNGTPVPGGTYVYELRGRENLDPESFRKFGHITIIK